MRSTFTGLNVPMPTCSVTRTISTRRRARDVRRQGRDAEALDLLHVAGETDDDRAFLFLDDRGGERLRERHHIARLHALRRTAPGLPRHRIALAREQKLDRILHRAF